MGFGLRSLRELPGIDELRAAGLLDPVDDAMIETALGPEAKPAQEAGETASEADHDTPVTGAGQDDDGLPS